jgi:DNA helicase II / ATP-dependent DNA helicase PcrA
MRLFAQRCHAISIVGDPDQGIYGWRNANSENISQMREDYRNVRVVSLEENYRSSTWILKISLAIIEQDSKRFAKSLIGTKGLGIQPVLRTLTDVQEEARWIAKEINRVMGLTGGMVKSKDVAILVRASRMTRPVESALTSAGLRYKMVGSLYNNAHDRLAISDSGTERRSKMY